MKPEARKLRQTWTHARRWPRPTQKRRPARRTRRRLRPPVMIAATLPKYISHLRIERGGQPESQRPGCRTRANKLRPSFAKRPAGSFGILLARCVFITRLG